MIYSEPEEPSNALRRTSSFMQIKHEKKKKNLSILDTLTPGYYNDSSLTTTNNRNVPYKQKSHRIISHIQSSHQSNSNFDISKINYVGYAN